MSKNWAKAWSSGGTSLVVFVMAKVVSSECRAERVFAYCIIWPHQRSVATTSGRASRGQKPGIRTTEIQN